MKKLLQQALDLVFPAVRCLACDEPRQIDAGAPLCDRCQLALDQLRVPDSACGHCLSPMQSGRPCSYCAAGGMAHIDQAFAPFVYRDVSAALIKRLKYGVVALAANPLAREMALAISGIRFDALVPVPLYHSRRRERGMNQSDLLCQLIAEETGFPVLSALQKIRDTKRQSSLPAHRRPQNVKGAFALDAPVQGMDILLVDDVRTTGSTVRECAGVLKAGGAASVCLLTAAVAKARIQEEQVRIWNSLQEPSA
jgi:ComF family protein